jgi:hypothetical protein
VGNVTGNLTGNVTSTGITNNTNTITNNSTLAQVGTSTFTGNITANNSISLGNTNTDTVKIIINIVSNNISELALTPGDDGSSSTTVLLPISEEYSSNDYVTIRSSNAGVHHAFSTAGNYYYRNSLVPSYPSLPTITTLQIGGSTSSSFEFNTYYFADYQYVTTTLPTGYFLVQGYLDVGPSMTNQYINLGLRFETTPIEPKYSQYHKFQSTSRVYLQFNYYVNEKNAVNYNCIFYSNASVTVTKGKCTFI